jgi:hypothetical protein
VIYYVVTDEDTTSELALVRNFKKVFKRVFDPRLNILFCPGSIIKDSNNVFLRAVEFNQPEKNVGFLYFKVNDGIEILNKKLGISK